MVFVAKVSLFDKVEDRLLVSHDQDGVGSSEKRVDPQVAKTGGKAD
jgi:hypothetical protein